LLVSALSAGAAGANGQSSPQLVLALPAPGHVTLAELQLRLPDVKGKRLRLRVPLSFSANSLPNGAKALSTVLARRVTGATVYTILLAAVNGGAASNAEADASGPPAPIDSSFVASAAAVLSFPGTGPAPAAQPIAVALTAPQPAGFAASSTPVSYLDPATRKQYRASAVEAVDVDEATPSQRATVARQFGQLGAPTDVLAARSATYAQYDASHPLGWRLASPSTKRAARDAWSLLTAAPQDLAAALQRLEAELGLAGTAPPPPAGGPDQLYRFSIGAFQFSFDTPPPQPTHITFSSPGATACGTDPVGAAWNLPYTVEAGAAASGSVNVRFTDANPFQIYLFFDYLPPGSITAPLATLSAAISPLAGPNPQMQVILAPAGAVSNVSGPTPPLLPIVRTPATSC
jgi:hypothetical protein